MRLGPAARGEGPAGYKGVERAREAAPRDSTTAGDSEPGPGDDCEFKAATLPDIHQNILMHTMHTSKHAVRPLFLNTPRCFDP